MSTELENAQKMLQKAFEMYWSGERDVAMTLFEIAIHALRCAIEYDRLAQTIADTWYMYKTGLEDLYLKRVNLYKLYDEFNVLYEQYYGYDDFCDQYGL